MKTLVLIGAILFATNAFGSCVWQNGACVSDNDNGFDNCVGQSASSCMHCDVTEYVVDGECCWGGGPGVEYNSNNQPIYMGCGARYCAHVWHCGGGYYTITKYEGCELNCGYGGSCCIANGSGSCKLKTCPESGCSPDSSCTECTKPCPSGTDGTGTYRAHTATCVNSPV